MRGGRGVGKREIVLLWKRIERKKKRVRLRGFTKSKHEM